MNCPGCGGALKPVGNRNHLQCVYCGRFHFPEEAGACFVATGLSSDWSCPVCPSQLLDCVLVEGQPAHACRNCLGILSDIAAFARAIGQRRSRVIQARAEQPPFDRSELRRGIKCPKCHRRMEAYPYAGGGNAVVDGCESCQLIWLDAGELEMIGDYLPAATPRTPCQPLISGHDDEGLLSRLFDMDTRSSTCR